MIAWLQELHPVMQALVGTLFTWLMTALGAGAVFVFKEIRRKTLDGMLGFAAGVMIAASFWSLLAPSIEMAGQMGITPWVPAVVGFMLGGGFLVMSSRLQSLLLGPRIGRTALRSSLRGFVEPGARRAHRTGRDAQKYVAE